MDKSSLPPLDVFQRYTITQTSWYLKQCESKTFADIKAGRIKTIKDGRRTYIPGSEIAARSCLKPMSENLFA